MAPYLCCLWRLRGQSTGEIQRSLGTAVKGPILGRVRGPPRPEDSGGRKRAGEEACKKNYKKEEMRYGGGGGGEAPPSRFHCDSPSPSSGWARGPRAVAGGGGALGDNPDVVSYSYRTIEPKNSKRSRNEVKVS
jgi:hypothetical protein